MGLQNGASIQLRYSQSCSSGDTVGYNVVECKSVIKTGIRRAIVEMLRTTDIDKLHVADVVSRAGIARSSFYRYYDSVDDAIKEMERDYLDVCREVMKRFVASGFTENGLEDRGNAIEQLLEIIWDNKTMLGSLCGPHGDPAFVREREIGVKEFYGSKLFFEGIVPKDIDLRMSFIIAGQTGLIDKWISEYPEVSAGQVAESLQRICYAVINA